MKVQVGIIFFKIFFFSGVFTSNFGRFLFREKKKNNDFLICKVYCIVNKISVAKTEASVK